MVHHDSSIGDWTLIGSGVTIAGGVTVGENCYIGSAASVMNDLQIGAQSLIGLGTTVIRSVPPRSKIVGNPARIIGSTQD